MSFEPGLVIAGRYRLVRPLAEGGMGSIWVARHLQLASDVALKLMAPELCDTPDARARFEREAKAAARLRSPHIVQMVDYGLHEESPFLVMELLSGESLEARLERVRRMTPSNVAELAIEIAKGLGVAHSEGVIHRDLKPANIFHARLGDEEVVKLVDFGIAKEIDKTVVFHDTASGVLLGSPDYMSPEQIRSSPLDQRSDLWSLAVVMFRALTGTTPFETRHPAGMLGAICSGALAAPSSARAELGTDFDAFFERALARNPELRFESAREMANEFAKLANPVPRAVPSADDSVGQRFGDRFVLEARAGAGGMGIVHRARDTLSDEPVALKLMRNHAEPERFAREARLLAELDHPGIVRYIAHGGGAGEPAWVAMEWLEGRDLSKRLEQSRLTVRESVELLRRIAHALGVAHARGIVHRDLKPSNLWLVDDELARVKIIDFGVAHAALDQTPRTETGAFIGTPHYVAPEQARSEREVDARADVFSLGCVLFECLTGEKAFWGEHVMAVLAKILLDDAPRARELDERIPAAIDELLCRLLAKDPALRPADARALAAELDALPDRELDVSPRDPERITIKVPSLARVVPTLGITGEEQHVISVIVLGGGASRNSLDALVQPYEGRVERLADGSRIVLLPRGGAATDQAARAAACALALSSASHAALAVATGRARVGLRAPIGDAIDRAAALLSRARQRHGELPRPAVWIDEVTAALLDERFARSQDATGIRLLGVRELDGTRALLGKPTPCVGRDAELAMLEALFSQCANESVARAAVVTGAAGIGKSRLRRELLARTDAEIWLAQGDPVAGGAAFGLAAEMVRRAAGVLEGESAALSRDKLAARVARHVTPSDRQRVTLFLAQMIGVPFEHDDDVSLASARGEALVMGDQIRRAWVDLIAAECSAKPLLLVLEDLHHGDRPTITLIDDALRLLADRPLMVLALARPDVGERFAGLWQGRDVHRFSLSALPKRSAEQLVRAVLGADTPASTVSELVDQAAGNAFFLEELIRFEAEGGRGESHALPETVVAMVAARLEALDATDRRILRAASVFGQIFWEGAVRALLGDDLTPAELTARLDRLVDRELVVRRRESKFGGQRELAFRHSFVREAAHAMLTNEDLELGHALAAAWLERAGEVDQRVIAQHHEQGKKLDRAAIAYARAAERALDGNDFDEALLQAERGARCGATGVTLGRLLRAQADAHYWRGESEAAMAHAERALAELTPGDDTWSDAAGIVAASAMRLGRSERLRAIGGELCRLLEQGAQQSGVIRAAARAAQPALMAGLADLSAALTDHAEAAAQATPDPVTRIRVLRARAHHALHRGDAARFLELMTLARRASEDAGDVRSTCVIGVNTGFAELEIGAYDAAERSLSSAIQQARQLGLTDAVNNAEHNLGWALARLGRLEEARQLEERVVRVFAAAGNPRMEGASRAYLSAILAELGDPASAEREARRAVELLEAAPPLQAWALATLAEVLVLASRPGEAVDAAERALSLLEHLGGIEQGEGRVRLLHVVALGAAGEHAAAERALSIAHARLLERAAQISDEAMRSSFLENVPEHAQTLRLVRGS